jgi:hypothetical protein
VLFPCSSAAPAWNRVQRRPPMVVMMLIPWHRGYHDHSVATSRILIIEVRRRLLPRNRNVGYQNPGTMALVFKIYEPGRASVRLSQAYGKHNLQTAVSPWTGLANGIPYVCNKNRAYVSVYGLLICSLRFHPPFARFTDCIDTQSHVHPYPHSSIILLG